MNRRSFLESVLGGAALVAASPLLLPGRASAIGDRQKLKLIRIRHGGHWSPHDNAVVTLAREISYRTSIDVALEAPAMTPDDDAMHEQALAVLTGDRDFGFSERERDRLKRWLELGGFLLIDNSGQEAPSRSFDRAVRRELERMFPNKPLGRVSSEHVVYRSFYRLDYPAGRAIHKPFVEGLKLGKRYAVIYSHNDMFGALATDSLGEFLHVPTPGGANQREMAMRFAVNLVMYGMCLHYKDDQVHLDHLLHRRKWKITPPE